MTDNELLLAISNMLDTKLKPLDVRLENLEDRLENLEDRLENLEGRLENLEGRLEQVEDRLEKLEGRLEQVEGQIVLISNWMVQIDDRTKKLEVLIEYDIKPRLQNIESCYTSTFDRYKRGVEQIETMQSDVDIMKKVLEDHSKKLQKIC